MKELTSRTGLLSRLHLSDTSKCWNKSGAGGFGKNIITFRTVQGKSKCPRLFGKSDVESTLC
jgi:hypothetical protein